MVPPGKWYSHSPWNLATHKGVYHVSRFATRVWYALIKCLKYAHAHLPLTVSQMSFVPMYSMVKKKKKS